MKLIMNHDSKRYGFSSKRLSVFTAPLYQPLAIAYKINWFRIFRFPQSVQICFKSPSGFRFIQARIINKELRQSLEKYAYIRSVRKTLDGEQ